MSDLVPNDPAYGPVVHVLWSAAAEENPLEDAGWYLYGVLYGRVEGVHHGGVAVPHPVLLVHWLPQLGEGVVHVVAGDVEPVTNIRVRAQLQTSVQTGQFLDIQQFRGVADVLLHGLGLLLGSLLGHGVHPVHLVEDLEELLPDVVHHADGLRLGPGWEIFLDIKRADQGAERARHLTAALLPPGRLGGLTRHLHSELQGDPLRHLTEVTQGGGRDPPEDVVSHHPGRGLSQQATHTLDVLGNIYHHHVLANHLGVLWAEDDVDVLQPGSVRVQAGEVAHCPGVVLPVGVPPRLPGQTDVGQLSLELEDLGHALHCQARVRPEECGHLYHEAAVGLNHRVPLTLQQDLPGQPQLGLVHRHHVLAGVPQVGGDGEVDEEVRAEAELSELVDEREPGPLRASSPVRPRHHWPAAQLAEDVGERTHSQHLDLLPVHAGEISVFSEAVGRVGRKRSRVLQQESHLLGQLVVEEGEL